jgi:hypothetical protein
MFFLLFTMGPSGRQGEDVQFATIRKQMERVAHKVA